MVAVCVRQHDCDRRYPGIGRHKHAATKRAQPYQDRGVEMIISGQKMRIANTHERVQTINGK